MLGVYVCVKATNSGHFALARTGAGSLGEVVMSIHLIRRCLHVLFEHLLPNLGASTTYGMAFQPVVLGPPF